MSVVISYEPGVPCWVDVGSTDLERSIAFYDGLFGWRAVRLGPEAGGYVRFRLDGVDVAAVGPAHEGAPPMWTTYFATEDADASADGIAAAGGEILTPPFDVPGAGRMAVARDPTGAVFALWQAKGHSGTGIVDEPVSPTWHELATRDVEAAVAFYGDVFGWGPEALAGGESFVYRVMKLRARTAAGIMALPESWGEDHPPCWSVYFAVEDADQTVARAEELGGAVVSPPRDTPYGRTAVLHDPLGASFSVIRLAEESVA